MFKAPKTRISSWHDEKQTEWLRKMADERGCTISELVRWLVSATMAEFNTKALDKK